ncbi:MAG: MFS transporter [Bryobacterales bacterium]|nr:MFS transporter [Bryobacterales bacterium]
MRQRLTPFIVIFAIFLSFSAIGSTLPLMPLYLRQDLGLDRFYTGVLIGLLSAAALAGRLWAGPFADRRGRRAGLWLGFCLCSVAGLLYLPLFGVAGMAIGRLTHGLGEAFILTGGVAWMVDTAPEGGRSQALGYLASGVWGGLAVGPLVAEAMRTFPHTAMLVTAAGVLSALVLFATQAPPVRKGGPKPKMRLGVVALPGSILGFTNIGYAVLAAFMPLLLDSRGLSGGPAFTAFAMTVLTSRLLLGSLPDRWGPRKTLMGGLATMAAGFSLLLASHSVPMSVAAAAIVGFGYSFPWPSLAVIVVGRVARARTGFGFGRAHRLLRSLRRRWRSRCGRHWQSVRAGAGLLLRDRKCGFRPWRGLADGLGA